jgi:hypothetical protein
MLIQDFNEKLQDNRDKVRRMRDKQFSMQKKIDEGKFVEEEMNSKIRKMQKMINELTVFKKTHSKN